MKEQKISSYGIDRKKKKSKQLPLEDNIEQEVVKAQEEKTINSFCSFQKRVGPPEFRKWRRIHGLQLPLHPQQIVGWIILLVLGGATFFVMIPALRSVLRDSLFIVLGTLFGLHILSHLTALLLDPANPELRKAKVKFAVPEFDRSIHTHVIENGRCHLCNIKTGPKTKHCSVCNKCIDRFDHHCKWLNHCIGGRNYVPFLICVVSAVAASLVVVSVSILEVVYYHIYPDSLTIFSNHSSGAAQELFLPDSVFLGIVIILGLLSASTAGLLLHLCLFHCYISLLGISTYEYIRNYRKEDNGFTQLQLIFTNNCCHTKEEIMSNRIDVPQNTRNKNCLGFKNCCYSSFTRPPKYDENGETDEYCLRLKPFFDRTQNCLKINHLPEKKILKHQSTDPEFVDKIIKPFLITLNEEKKPEAGSSETKVLGTCFCKTREQIKDDTVKEHLGSNIKSSEDTRRKSFSTIYRRFIKFFNQNSSHNIGMSGKIRNNQICPNAPAENVDPNAGRCQTTTKSKKTFGDEPGEAVVPTTKVTPELGYSLKQLNNSLDLKKLDDVLDMIDKPFDFSPVEKFVYHNERRKELISRSKSPELSPIIESRLSNSEQLTQSTLSPIPIFTRPTTPETSLIFLSNPSSLSSSSAGEANCRVGEVAFNSDCSKEEDVFQTPRLPRKASSHDKEAQIFIIETKKKRPNKLIDREIQNDISTSIFPTGPPI